MKFYNREQELGVLAQLHDQAGSAGRMSVITGRRRVGKTMLALEFARTHKFVYLFVSKKSEHLLCSEFIEEIKKHFAICAIHFIWTPNPILSGHLREGIPTCPSVKNKCPV